jgi:hypothetical protein
MRTGRRQQNEQYVIEVGIPVASVFGSRSIFKRARPPNKKRAIGIIVTYSTVKLT